MDFKKYFFLILCFFFKLESAYEMLNLDVPTIKEAYAWILTPQTLSPEMNNLRQEIIRRTNLQYELVKDASNLAEFANEQLLGAIEKLEGLEAATNQIFTLMELCIKLKNGSEYSRDLIKRGESSVLETDTQEANDTRLLLNVLRSFHEDLSSVITTAEEILTIPLAVRKLFKNTLDYHKSKGKKHAANPMAEEYIDAVFNTFIWPKFAKDTLGLKKAEREKVREDKKDDFLGNIPWMREKFAENPHYSIKEPLHLCEFITLCIEHGWIEEASPPNVIIDTPVPQPKTKKKKRNNIKK